MDDNWFSLVKDVPVADLADDERVVLREALREFVDRRSPIERYLAIRYLSHSESFLSRKRAELAGRIGIAKRLFAATHADSMVPVSDFFD